MATVTACDYCGFISMETTTGWIEVSSPLELEFCCMSCLGSYFREKHPGLVNENPPKH